MLLLLTAVVTASLLGSMHCVGMCGPLAIWASGAGQQTPRRQLVTAAGLYHLGRLLTYALAGLIAGAVGQLADFGGQALGIQLFAARLAGGMMIAAGVVKLWQMWRLRSGKGAKQTNVKQTSISGLLVRLRPYVMRLPIAARGLATGLLTALLPCGWLYLFALVAAGTGSVTIGPLVMAAFWVGTVPALVGLVAGSAFLATRFRTVVPVVAAVLLIVGGCYTAAGRGFAKLNSLSDIRPAAHVVGNVGSDRDHAPTQPVSAADLAASIGEVASTPLPCCEHCATEDSTANTPAKQTEGGEQ
ncbi:MAG: sulfite exporter TauE/SafE family protein [Aureliella sp.]